MARVPSAFLPRPSRRRTPRPAGVRLRLEALEDRVTPSVNVLTYHNDVQRTGLNPNETVLTPANVNVNTFGLLFNLAVDGKVDAEPLYLSGLAVPGQGAHNVVFVATEHDSLYAFDADNGALLWHDGPAGTPTTLLPAGETPSDPVFGSQVTPEIGVTSTPVIDPTTDTLYLVTMSKDGAGHYFQRLHAIDVTTGREKLGGPTTIQATFGGLTFDPRQYKERDALLLVNGVVYISFASHSDHEPYTGWLMGYDASTLQQVSVLDTDPATGNDEGSYWNSGNGWASDGVNLYNLSGNGVFGTMLNGAGFPANGDFGNAVVEVSSVGGLHVADYFTMHNTVAESNADADLGSGGALLLPDLFDGGGVVRHLMLAAGKDGNIYVLDRDNLGKFSANADNIYQELIGALPGGMWGSPAYFNGAVYYGPAGGALREFALSGARLVASPASQTGASFGYPGTTPSISSNGATDGIVWAYENAADGQAVLHAYDARNLGIELYNSTQAGARDAFGQGNKFITPMIADGHVYAATTNGVAVFGLLPSPPPVPPPPPFVGMGFGPFGEVVEVVSSAGVLTQYDAFGAHPLTGGVRSASVAFNAGSEVLLITTQSGMLLQCDAAGTHLLGGGVLDASVAFGPSGEVVEVVSTGGVLTQYDAFGAHPFTSGVTTAGVAFTPSGSEVVALTTQNGVLLQADAAGLHVVTGGVRAAGVAFASDGAEVLDVIFQDDSLFQFDAAGAHRLGMIP